MKTVLAVVLIVLGTIFLVWASVTIVALEQAIREQPDVYRVAYGHPIAIFFGLGFIAVGAWLLYMKRPRAHKHMLKS